MDHQRQLRYYIKENFTDSRIGVAQPNLTFIAIVVTDSTNI
jgi:hypothetical protein